MVISYNLFVEGTHWVLIRDDHAVHADNAYMQIYADADDNLMHIKKQNNQFVMTF